MNMFLIQQLLVFLLVCPYSYGQREKHFFRKDYKYLEATQTFYKVHNLEKTWLDAKATCEREGAGLFYPEDDIEAEAVLKVFGEESNSNWFYIGVSALHAKGAFETIHGAPVIDIFHKWGKGEPNDIGGEDCVILQDTKYLTDVSCNNKEAFVCSKRLTSVQWNYDCNMPDPDYVYDKNLGRCYKFHQDFRNWTEAYAICNAEQSYLAVIDNNDEEEFLLKIMEKALKVFFPRASIHLGFHNRFEEGWRTIKGVPLNESWYEWNQLQLDGRNMETCGSIFYTREFYTDDNAGKVYTGQYKNKELHAVSCSRESFFICEHEIHVANPVNNQISGQIN